jgi:hypothetical protein
MVYFRWAVRISSENDKRLLSRGKVKARDPVAQGELCSKDFRILGGGTFFSESAAHK